MFINDEKAQQLFDIITEDNSSVQTPIPKEQVHKWDNKQVVISDIKKIELDRVEDYLDTPEENIRNIYYSVTYPNLECEVCFDHPLDHYPLMMIFEMGRQFGIAASHKYYDVPLDGYANIVDSLSFEFKTFLELDKPVYIVCIDSEITDKKGIHRRHMNLAFVQEGVHCATGGGNVSVFSKALYKRMRMGSRKRIIPSTPNCIPTNRDILAGASDKLIASI